MKSMVRETSRKAFEELKRSGSLETQKGAVYELLKQYGPATQREIEKLYQEVTGKDDQVHRRFSELEREGLIKATKEVTCSVTQRGAFAWEADPQDRLVSIKPQSKRERIKELEETIERISKAKSLKEVRAILGTETQDYSPPVLRLSHKTITDLFD
jgi:DNA-binding transcriptional regulator YhcF (GntR family)